MNLVRAHRAGPVIFRLPTNTVAGQSSNNDMKMCEIWDGQDGENVHEG